MQFRCLQEMNLGSEKIVSFKELNKAQSASRDEKFARLKRFVEKRDRDTAHVTVASIDTAQYRSPRSPTPGPSFDECVRVEMEKKDEGTMDPERYQLEPPSASTGFETPEQQCPPNGETGRTTTDGCLLVGVGSNLGGNIYAPAEIATPPAASNIIFLQASRKPDSRRQLKRKTSNLSLAGTEKTHRSGKQLYWLAFSEGNACPGCLLFVLRVFYYQVIPFQRAEVHLRREKKADDERNRRASIILPISPLKMVKIITTIPGSMCRNALGIG